MLAVDGVHVWFGDFRPPSISCPVWCRSGGKSSRIASAGYLFLEYDGRGLTGQVVPGCLRYRSEFWK
jgi:hypothetical protein